ncbi:FecR family protein [Methylomonas sp. 2BW1-5-20]|uniref:FecR family protein n=1 Tax=Methylomonas sp. 2BW1-5-20 TaxID=3376686 RepID=UPI00404F1E49
MSDEQPSPDDTPQEQAGFWIVRQHSGDWSRRDSLAFEKWLDESVEHRQAFEQVQALWQGLDRYQAGAELQPHQVKPQTPAPRGRRWPAIAALATVASLCFFILLDTSYIVPSLTRYATTKGQHASFNLSDGSQISLNTDTELTVQLGPLQRSVTIVRGEASFNIAHGIWRCFTVQAGSGKIIDIGTRFNIYQQANQVEITVLAGAVKVETARQSSPVLSAGQKLSYGADGLLSKIERPDLSAITAWEQGQMVFDMTPLDQAVEQLGRYHAAIFVIDDPKLKQLKISGTFNTGDLKLFLTTLESIYPIKAVQGNDHTVHLTARGRP